MNTSMGGAAASASVLLVGLSHRCAPVHLLERVCVADADLPTVLRGLVEHEALSEALVLSTCNRMEFYVATSAFHAGLDHVIEQIAHYSGVEKAALEPHLYVHYSHAAAEHMLHVAAGLDSMVVGEQQIIGQLRSAYQRADQTGTVGRNLHDLTQRALHTGKRVHTETQIDTAGASMVSFAVNKALDFLSEDIALCPQDNAGEHGAAGIQHDTAQGDTGQANAAHNNAAQQAPLRGKKALIIGAGAMAALASTYIGKLGIEQIFIANRTPSRAETLADHARQAGVQAQGIALEDMTAALGTVDLVLSATGSTEHVLSREQVEAAVNKARVQAHKPLVICDLSMPRDIEQSVADLEGVTLLNIAELSTLAGEDIHDEDAARHIVACELAQFLEEQRALEIVPTLKAMRQQAADVVTEELLLLENHTPDMAAEDRAEVVKTVRRVVDKLLHTPTVQAKKLSADGGRVSYSDALAALFNVPQGAVESVTQARSDAGVSDAGLSVAGAGASGLSVSGEQLSEMLALSSRNGADMSKPARSTRAVSSARTADSAPAARVANSAPAARIADSAAVRAQEGRIAERTVEHTAPVVRSIAALRADEVAKESRAFLRSVAESTQAPVEVVGAGIAARGGHHD